MQQFHKFDKQSASEFRSFLCRCNSRIFLRLVARLLLWPYPIFIVADPDRSFDDKRKVIREFLIASLHDLDPQLCRKLKRILKHEDDFFEDWIQCVLYLMALLCMMHTQPVENRHASHRGILTCQSAYRLFASRACNAEVVRQLPSGAFGDTSGSLVISDCPRCVQLLGLGTLSGVRIAIVKHRNISAMRNDVCLYARAEEDLEAEKASSPPGIQ